MRRRVELEVTGLEHRRALAALATDERPQPRRELLDLEGLDEVVVGASVQAGHALFQGTAGSEHEHRRPDLVGPQAPAGLETVDAGQHDVELTAS
jgi:hypothetical protein